MAKKPIAQRMPRNFEEAVDAELKRLKEILLKKQADYGHENILAFGEFGVLVRTNDKIARLRNLLNRRVGEMPMNESIEDTWTDNAGYGIIALMLRHGTFMLPLAKDIQRARKR